MWYFNNQSIKYNRKKTEEGIELNVELPGYSKEDIKISHHDGEIKIKTNDNKSYLLSPQEDNLFVMAGEPFYKNNQQHDLHNITAKMKNGLLTIVIPQKKEKAKEIPIC